METTKGVQYYEKEHNHTNKKKIVIISGLSALCIAILACAYLLTREPGYEPTPSQQPEQNAPSGGGGTDDSHPRQVYDPVFGWVTPNNVQQDNIDSDDDINKQIGTMCGN